MRRPEPPVASRDRSVNSNNVGGLDASRQAYRTMECANRELVVAPAGEGRRSEGEILRERSLATSVGGLPSVLALGVLNIQYGTV